MAGIHNKNVVYIDTGGGFSSERIHEILMGKRQDGCNTMVSHSGLPSYFCSFVSVKDFSPQNVCGSNLMHIWIKVTVSGFLG